MEGADIEYDEPGLDERFCHGCGNNKADLTFGLCKNCKEAMEKEPKHIKTNEQLEILKQKNIIKDYEYCDVNCYGEVGKVEKLGRNTERLTITFNTGDKLTIDASCSGCLENVNFNFEVSEIKENK